MADVPGFLSSNISFGLYTFPNGFKLVSADQQTKLDELEIPFLDGAHAPPGYLSSKVIRLNGMLGGSGALDSNGNYIKNRDDLDAEINVMAQQIESGYQYLTVGISNRSRVILAQKRKFIATYMEGTRNTVTDIQIEFIAPDPRWLNSVPSIATFPANGGAATLTSNGSATSYPVFTIVGAATNPYIQITPVGFAGVLKVQPIVTLGSTDTLVINCDSRARAQSIMLNGAYRLDLLGPSSLTNNAGTQDFFPLIRPGGNPASVGADNAPSNNFNASVAWNDAYLF